MKKILLRLFLIVFTLMFFGVSKADAYPKNNCDAEIIFSLDEFKQLLQFPRDFSQYKDNLNAVQLELEGIYDDDLDIIFPLIKQDGSWYNPQSKKKTFPDTVYKIKDGVCYSLSHTGSGICDSARKHSYSFIQMLIVTNPDEKKYYCTNLIDSSRVVDRTEKKATEKPQYLPQGPTGRTDDWYKLIPRVFWEGMKGAFCRLLPFFCPG